MASLIQSQGGNGGGYVNSYTFSITPTAGNTLILCFGCGTSDIPTISDNQSNTWNKDVGIIQTSQRQAIIYHASSVAGAATTVTISFQASDFGDSAYIVSEWSGISSTPFDQSGTNTIASGTSYPVTLSSATTQANELLIGCNCITTNSPGFTGDASYTNVLSGGITQAAFDLYTSTSSQYRVVSSMGTYSWTMTGPGSQNAAIALASYKITGGVVTTYKSNLMTMGVG